MNELKLVSNELRGAEMFLEEEKQEVDSVCFQSLNS